ncbi:MAG: hypothetical protein AMR96_06235 [Candidatus Adiutrix intracellularis]|nr:MAG: hypothetical protein AMR96_06235 [Candidatus Adiutrix intracellularis]
MDNKNLLFESRDLFLERVIPHMISLKKGIGVKDLDIYMPEVNTLKNIINFSSTASIFETTKKLENKDHEKIIDINIGGSF